MGDDGKQTDDARAKLISRLNDLVERALKDEPRPSSRWGRIFAPLGSFLNSAFFVTVVSGILLAWLTVRWQDRAAAQREKEAEAKQIADRKDALAYTFAKEFPLTVHLARRFMSRSLWLKSPEARAATAHFPADGRTFIETRDYTERLLEQYFSLNPAGSICNQIVASFSDSPRVVSLALTVNSNVTDLLNATNEDLIDSAFAAANTNYQSLTKAIFTELNQANK